MTETEKDEATSTNEIADADFSEADREPEIEAAATAPRRGFTASIAWLALFLALISFAAAGYTLFNNWRSAPEVDETAAEIDALNARISTLEGQLASQSGEVDDLSAVDRRLSGSINSLQGELNERASLFDSLPPRMTSLERSVASLQGVSIDARNTYLVAEAEYYLQIANAQLQLAGNAYLATLALEQADDRLIQLGDPALTDVRRAISNERAALEVMERPDLAGATLTLGSLSQVVDSLPLRPTTSTDEASAEADAAEGGEEEPSGVSRAWNSVTGAFEELVRITPPTEDIPALLLLEAEPLIRSNLSLQLQAARLALLRGEQQVFETSLDDADAWLELYFDTDNAQVESVRQTLGSIRVDYSSVAPPDISESLRLLRQFKLLSESAAPRPAASRPPAPRATAARPAVSAATAAEPEVSEPAAPEPDLAETPAPEPAVSEATESEPEPSEEDASEADVPEVAASEDALSEADASEPPVAEAAITEDPLSEATVSDAEVADPEASEPDE